MRRKQQRPYARFQFRYHYNIFARLSSTFFFCILFIVTIFGISPIYTEVTTARRY